MSKKYDIMTVADIPDKDSIIFVSDSQDVLSILESVGMAGCEDEYGSLFVEVGDGKYLNIWAMGGIVPYLDQTIIKIL